MIPAEILRQVRRLQLRARRAVDSLLVGDYAAAFRGTGLSFDEVREYMPGDDVRSIDWNVTARFDKPYIKRYREERDVALLIAVDSSGRMDFGSTARTKKAVAADLAALLAFAALQNGDRVGFLAFSDRIEHYSPPRLGTRPILRGLREILAPRLPKPSKPGEAMAEIHRLLPRRAVIFLLSDFQGEYRDADVRRLAARHDLIGIRISDRLEREWPARSRLRLSDAETGKIVYSNGEAVQQIAAVRQQRSRVFEKLIRSTNAELIDIDTDGEHFDALIAFLRRRAR